MCKYPSQSDIAESENSESPFLSSNRSELDVATFTSEDSAVRDEKYFLLLKMKKRL